MLQAAPRPAESVAVPDAALLLVAEDIAKSYAASRRSRRFARRAAGRSAWARGGERGGQVDPDPHPGGADAARPGTDRGRRRAVAISAPQRAADLGMTFIHQELAFVPGMTVLQTSCWDCPNAGASAWWTGARSPARSSRWPGASASLPALLGRQGPVGRREVADQHLPRPRAKGPAHRHGRADRLALGDRGRDAAAHRRGPVALGRRGALRLAPPRRDPAPLPTASPRFATGGRWRRWRVPTSRGRASWKRSSAAPSSISRNRWANAQSDEVVLAVSGLTRSPRVRDVSLALHRGEVLGIGGPRRRRANRTRAPRLRRRPPGRRHDAPRGPPVRASPPDGRREGRVRLVPEERRSEGLVLTKSVAFNLNSPACRGSSRATSCRSSAPAGSARCPTR